MIAGLRRMLEEHDGRLLESVSAVIVTTVAATDIVAALRQDHGGAVFHAPAALSLAPASGGPSSDAGSGPGLTERECTILSAGRLQ